MEKTDITEERGKVEGTDRRKCQRVAKVGWTARGKRFDGGERENGNLGVRGWNKQFDMGIDGDAGERDDGNPNLSPRANGDTMQCE